MIDINAVKSGACITYRTPIGLTYTATVLKAYGRTFLVTRGCVYTQSKDKTIWFRCSPWLPSHHLNISNSHLTFQQTQTQQVTEEQPAPAGR